MNRAETLISTLDINAIRQDFPVLKQTVNGYPLIYFDNAATTQKPQSVIDAMSHYYECDNANVHRGVHAPPFNLKRPVKKSAVLLTPTPCASAFLYAAQPKPLIW